ncbi:MAG: DUF4349 domain-containing protein [Candidatus Uhrbacteria bacterium]
MQKQTVAWIAAGAVVVILSTLLLLTTSSTVNLPFGMMNKLTTSSVAPMMFGSSAGAPEFAITQDSASSFDGSIAAPGMMRFAPPEVPPTAGQTAAEVDQKIIKTGSLSLTVASVAETSPKIVDLATKAGGYAQNSSVSEDQDGTHAGYVTVRVPSDKFETTVTAIKALATVVNVESTNGQDVTEQYSDLEAQLRNAQAQEAQYLEILKQAKTVDETLNVQQYLSNVRGTIESLQGRIKYLSNATTYSTIDVSLSEKPSIHVPTKGFDLVSTAKEAAQALVAIAQNLGVAIVWLVIVGGGILLPIALAVWGIVAIVRKAKGKNKKR